MARSGKNYEKSIQAFLGEGTEFKGVISFEGTVRVDGVFEGEVITDDTFIVGQAAKVNANIKAGVVIVMGTLDGRVEAKEKCEIRVGSTMKGRSTPRTFISKREPSSRGLPYDGRGEGHRRRAGPGGRIRKRKLNRLGGL